MYKQNNLSHQKVIADELSRPEEMETTTDPDQTELITSFEQLYCFHIFEEYYEDTQLRFLSIKISRR